MIGFPLMSWIRQSSDKLDAHLRNELIRLYRPFRWIPCFIHRWIEKQLKRLLKIPVIIEFEEGEEIFVHGSEVVYQSLKRSDHTKRVELPGISCVAMKLAVDELECILSDCQRIKKIYYDRKVHALLNHATKAVRTEQINANGITGKDVTVAVVDTGIYPHDDFTKPQQRIVGFKDFVNGEINSYDDNGHGTHCAGNAAGNGFSSNGKYTGPAPEANLVGVKVLDKRGAGQLSNVMAGVEWCITNKEQYNIDIISLSLGSEATLPAQNDPMVKVVERAWDNGIVVCVAAGNSGPDQATIASPGISPKVITVGAMDDQDTPSREDDEVANFSSRGPTIDGKVKPDLLTPGVDIISTLSPGSYLDKMMKGSTIEEQYISLSGTSMATPICAGIVALLLEKYPDLTPDEVKQRLLDASVDWDLPPDVQGRGYLDAGKLFGF